MESTPYALSCRMMVFFYLVTTGWIFDIICEKSINQSIRTASGSGKYIGFGVRIQTGTERATIVDIFHIVQIVRNIGIHLKE